MEQALHGPFKALSNIGVTNKAISCLLMVDMDKFPKINDLKFYPKIKLVMNSTHKMPKVNSSQSSTTHRN